MVKDARDRLPFDDAVKAAKAYRATGMDMREIGRRLGYGHNTIRQALKAEAMQALESAIRRGSSPDPGTKPTGSGFAAMLNRTDSK